MVKWMLKKIVGNQNQRRLRKIWPIVQEINRIEEGLQKKTDDDLKQMTADWKSHLSRYQEEVEYFSARKFESMPLEELRPLAESWFKRYERLTDDFDEAKAQASTLRSVAMGGTVESCGKALLDAQTVYTKIREKFPSLRKDYLSQILPDALAVVKNAARRMKDRGAQGEMINVCDHPLKWEMVHFDVQLIGGIALHERCIAEMATGEGKTLVATLPVFLNALTSLGVHVVTVNDYLARRDSEWMGSLFRWLGLTVGCIQNSQDPVVRREQYQCDITYGTSSEFGFDYLRDNGMATTVENQVQRGHYYALIDEVDSILIDEARTPLIISGPVTTSTHQFDRFKPMVSQLVKKQIELCNTFASEAKQAFDAGDMDAAGLALFKVKIGQPRHRILGRMMEDPAVRRALEKAELSFYQDTRKAALFELKEELYFTIDERQNDSDLSEMGRKFLNPDDPDAFVLPDITTALAQLDGDTTLTDAAREKAKLEWQTKMDMQAQRMHCISQLLKAYCLFEKDKEYIIEENKVVILDENTGRAMPGRRWSDGLHQAVEAKEGVKIDHETQTLATITIQNYFRMYEKMAGMTGTAETEAAEFKDIYGVDVVVIPTNRPVQREDNNDRVYKTQREKLTAVLQLVKECNAKGQPILLGTASEKASEMVSRMMKLQKIPHSVLNAKHHRQEAEIVSRAGLKGTVTVATNMAGRGTDIKLGEGVVDLGGLKVIGTERHSSRRIDRQLRGRCARQGDPGSSIFFVSFEDDLMRQYGASERMIKLMERLNLEEGQELEGGLLTKTIEMAQRKVEERNYIRRKQVLQYDDVMNQQREVIYGYRNEVLTSEDPRSLVMEVIDKAVPARVDGFIGVQGGDLQKDYEGLVHWVVTTFPIRMKEKPEELAAMDDEKVKEIIVGHIKEAYEVKMAHEDPEHSDELERFVILMAVDQLWREHLYGMDGLREAIHWRAQGQKDPLVEYKKEGYELFVALMDSVENEILRNLFLYRTARPVVPASKLKAGLADLFGDGAPQAPPSSSTDTSKLSLSGAGGEEAPEGPKIQLPIRREAPKVGRNDPCYCGSGKKFKQCHGRSV